MKIENAQITHADLSMADHGVLCYNLELQGNGWGCCYGGYVIGRGYLGSKEFEGSAKGTESLMRIMDTVGVEKWSQLEGKYIRAVTETGCAPIRKIGNIISEKWFDAEEFFQNCETRKKHGADN